MLHQLRSLYEQELFESVVPFWMRHSLDREHGGYFTGLDRDGSLYDSRKYVWLNGRQVWLLARLYNSVEHRPEWLEAARLGAEFLRRHAFDEQGRCYFSLTREGQPAFFQRKPYAGFFVMLGFLEYAKASGDQWYAAKGRELFGRLRGWIADPGSLGRPALSGGVAYNQLADIYVMCAAALELGDDATLDECLAAIAAHYEPSRQLLYECAAVDPARRREFPDGRLICAGSIFEISWYLLRALDRRPTPGVEEILLKALDGAFEHCWDKEYGGFYYFIDIDGRPMLQLESDMKLWWVHAEALYALLTVYLRTGDELWLRRLEQVQEWVWRRFPDPVHGEWFGYLHRDGSLSHSLKGNHYKGCFHVPRALLFSLQALDRA
jgi:N-acylglucosamine 2-epimerase